jgi:hypothetical protein
MMFKDFSIAKCFDNSLANDFSSVHTMARDALVKPFPQSGFQNPRARI